MDDSEWQKLWDRHEMYERLEREALAGDSQAEAQVLTAVPVGKVHHFKVNSEGEHNSYEVKEVFKDKALSGEYRYFVRYVPLYENPSAPEYRRLLVGVADGEEDGWFLPVDKPEYKGPRFI